MKEKDFIIMFIMFTIISSMCLVKLISLLLS